MLKGRAGFAIGQILLILIVSSFLIIASFPIMSIKKKVSGGNNTDVIKCIVTEAAANLSSISCSTAVSASLKDRDNSYNTILSYIDSNEAAKKLMREVCRQGGEKACKYFLNQCLLDSNNCNNSSDYDLHYFLTLNYADSASKKILEIIEPYYSFSDLNVTNAIYSSCSASANSSGCKFVRDKCDSKVDRACNYFINRCKDDNICDVAGSEFDFYYLIYLNSKYSSADFIKKTITPYYGGSGNSNISNAVDSVCNSNKFSLACSIESIDETKCRVNNDDLACNNVANECISTGKIKRCNSLVQACNAGKKNACKYGYLNNITRNCKQIKSKLGSLYFNAYYYNYGISIDDQGNYLSLNCSGDYTKGRYYNNGELKEIYNESPPRQNWHIIQSATNSVRYDYDYWGEARTDYDYLMGGKDILSGTGYSADMYLEKTFSFYNIAHDYIKYEFNVWYCGPWNGERVYIFHDDILKYTSSPLYNTTPSSWKTADKSQDCRSFAAPSSLEIPSNLNTGILRIRSDLSSPPSEKSLGISKLWILLR